MAAALTATAAGLLLLASTVVAWTPDPDPDPDPDPGRSAGARPKHESTAGTDQTNDKPAYPTSRPPAPRRPSQPPKAQSASTSRLRRSTASSDGRVTVPAVKWAGRFTPNTALERGRLAVFAVALIATVTKLVVAANTYGTLDVRYFTEFEQGVRDFGPIGIYGHEFTE